MAEDVKVGSIAAMRDFRAALMRFGDTVRSALMEADAEIGRTIMWLRHEQAAYWKAQHRVRTERVREVRAELERKRLSQSHNPSLVLERRAVERAKAAVAEAEEKAEQSLRWARRLEHERDLYRGEVSGLWALADADVPLGVARLKKMIEVLEKYAETKRRPGGEGGGGETQDEAGGSIDIAAIFDAVLSGREGEENDGGDLDA